MPIRIKPKTDLGVCTLTLESIKGISELISNNFSSATYSASDDIWEIFDEPKDKFIQEISKRDTLDEFVISTRGNLKNNSSENDDTIFIEEMKIIFSQNEATVSFKAHPSQENWFEHFLIDLKKHILPPAFSQIVTSSYQRGDYKISFLTIFMFLVLSYGGLPKSIGNPYVRIVIRENPPNPFIENIKANLVSNLIWAMIGAIILLVAQWILRTYGVDINPFN